MRVLLQKQGIEGKIWTPEIVLMKSSITQQKDSGVYLGRPAISCASIARLADSKAASTFSRTKCLAWRHTTVLLPRQQPQASIAQSINEDVES